MLATSPNYWNLHSMKHNLKNNSYSGSMTSTATRKDNGTALPDGVKIAILLNKTKGALQQHLQLRAGQITNYNEIRVVILDYYKTISAFSRASSAVGTNYNGGTAPMDVDNIWRKGRNYKGQRQIWRQRTLQKETKEKASTEAKATTKDSTKAAKETLQQRRIQQEQREKATQDPTDMDQAKATKAKETTANQKGKETTTTQHAIDVASPATGHKTAECQYGT